MQRKTSLQALASLQKSGKSQVQAVTIYKYLTDNPQKTRQQISEDTGIAINAVCGRVKELIDGGFVVETGETKNPSGRRAYTLEVADCEVA